MSCTDLCLVSLKPWRQQDRERRDKIRCNDDGRVQSVLRCARDRDSEARGGQGPPGRQLLRSSDRGPPGARRARHLAANRGAIRGGRRGVCRASSGFAEAVQAGTGSDLPRWRPVCARSARRSSRSLGLSPRSATTDGSVAPRRPPRGSTTAHRRCAAEDDASRRGVARRTPKQLVGAARGSLHPGCARRCHGSGGRDLVRVGSQSVESRLGEIGRLLAARLCDSRTRGRPLGTRP